MKLIDVDALYDVVMDSIKPMTKNEAIILQDFIALVEDAPTIDAVEVVRCKDCKYYWKYNLRDDVPVCLVSVKDDAFCSEGERMDEALQWEEPEINPCRGCEDYDGQGGCLSKGGCGEREEDVEKTN